MKIRKTISFKLTALFFWFLFLFIIGGAVWHSSNQPIPIVVKKYESNKPGHGEYWTVQVGTHRKSGLYTRRLLKNGKVFYARVKESHYAAPIFVDSSGKVKSVAVSEYYLDDNQTVCGWFRDEKRQTITEETRDTMNNLISGL